MRNLFLLLWRNNFTLLFVLLQSFSVYLLVKNNRFQQAAFFNSSNAVTGSIMETVSYFTEYIHLRENNENLAKENALLKELLPDAYYENQIVRTIIDDSIQFQQYSYITGRVINNSVNKRNNYLTLDKGTEHGVRPEMGVISSKGVVGIVKDVSDHYCTVMSLLHKNTRLSARFRDNGYFGSVTWNGEDPGKAQLNEIPKHVTFGTGDTIVATRYSSIFPEGVIIGTVSGAASTPGGNFHLIELDLSTNFSNLSYVYIVDNLLKEEQRTLEQLTEESDEN
jgi:rod shape-determining protein MreC